MRDPRAWLLGAGLLWLAACGPSDSGGPGEILFTPDRPVLGTPVEVEPYTGSDPVVLGAQATYRTGTDLHRKLVMRTCGPTGGVCHNQKEYPDMHSPAAFAATVGAPCNIQPGSWSTVADRCERSGDRFRFVSPSFREVEVGYTELVPGEYVDHRSNGTQPTATSPGFHVYLQAPIPVEREEVYATGLFIRSFVDDQGNVLDLPFASYVSRWWILGGGQHLMAEVREYQVDAVGDLAKVGIVQGDQNRNGTYGARLGKSVLLLNPGKPEQSYLVWRLRGHSDEGPVAGTRMPLANQPPSVPDMLALMCFLEGLIPGDKRWSLESGIDYKNCSYSANPAALNIVGSGVTWRGRIKPMLESNCGGCHVPSYPGGAAGGLDLMSEGAHARLREPSKQQPTLKLVSGGRPELSYLYRKLSGDGSITGSRMPLDAQNVPRPLSDDDLSALATWILADAPEDG